MRSVVGATRVISPLRRRSRSHGRKISVFSGGGQLRLSVQYRDQPDAPEPYTCSGTPRLPRDQAKVMVGAQLLSNRATGCTPAGDKSGLISRLVALGVSEITFSGAE